MASSKTKVLMTDPGTRQEVEERDTHFKVDTGRHYCCVRGDLPSLG